MHNEQTSPAREAANERDFASVDACQWSNCSSIVRRLTGKLSEGNPRFYQRLDYKRCQLSWANHLFEQQLFDETMSILGITLNIR